MPCCPRCGTWIVRRSPLQSTGEHLLSLVTVYPLRCQLCTHRFPVLLKRFSVHYKREYERILVRYPAYFYLPCSGKDSKAFGIMVNLSIRGCRIKSQAVVAPGTSLVLRFEAVDREQDIEVKGAVVRSVMNGTMGIEFFEIEKEEEDRIRHIIEERLYARPFEWRRSCVTHRGGKTWCVPWRNPFYSTQRLGEFVYIKFHRRYKHTFAIKMCSKNLTDFLVCLTGINFPYTSCNLNKLLKFLTSLVGEKWRTSWMN